MKIALFTFGGFAYYPHLLIDSVLTLEKETLVFAPFSQKDEFVELLGRTTGFRFFHKPRMRYPTNLLLVCRLAQQVRRFHPDVIHLLGYYPWMYFGLLCLPGVPFVMTVHDPVRHSGDHEAIQFPVPPTFFYRKAAAIIVLSHAMKRFMQEQHQAPPERIHTVPHGNFSIYLRWVKEDIRPDRNTVLFFGRMMPYKGLEFLVDAAKIASRQTPNLRFVVAGSGNAGYREQIKRRASDSAQFIFLDHYVTDAAAARLFQEAAVVVLPYVDATQSGVIPMAYAFRRPVIATDVGGLAEYVHDGSTGYLVPPRDAAALAAKIVALVNNPSLCNMMGENGYRMSLSELSWDTIGKQTLQVYRKVGRIPEVGGRNDNSTL